MPPKETAIPAATATSVDLPPVTGPEKISPAAAVSAGTPIVETSSPTLDRRTGEPVSAEVRPEPVGQPSIFETLRSAAMTDPTNVGTLPAKGRVLASGHVVETGTGPIDTGVRVFTAAIRILRGEMFYEAGAPVPLTRSEFEAKRESLAVEERYWDEGVASDD